MEQLIKRLIRFFRLIFIEVRARKSSIKTEKQKGNSKITVLSHEIAYYRLMFLNVMAYYNKMEITLVAQKRLSLSRELNSNFHFPNDP